MPVRPIYRLMRQFLPSTRLIVICLLLVISWNISLGQSQIEGLVIEQQTNTPLPYSSVLVLSWPDSTQIAGGYTSENGQFSFPVEPGEYFLRISFLGYQTAYTEVQEVPANEKVRIAPISLQLEETSLAEVEIVGQASQMTLELDKRVYRVDQDLALAGSSADEILQNLPSVQVDAEGGVSLRGSQNVRILINGKPSGLVGIGGQATGLAMLQGNMIERIEVITNPSARYDAEGEVGIINIILKEERKNGFNGALTAATGWPHAHSVGANLNYRSGMVNWFANLSGQYRASPGGGSYYQEEKTDGIPTFITEQTSDRIRAALGGNFRTGADILFNPYNTLTLSGLISKDAGENTTSIVYRDFDGQRTPLATVVRDEVETETSDNLEFNGTFRKTYPQKDREWVSTLQYQLNDDLELGDILEQQPARLIRQQSTNNEAESNWLIQSDYVHPFGQNSRMKAETGTRITLRNIDNDYLVEEENTSGVFEALPAFDNEFRYIENIYAGYGILSQQLDQWAWQVGVRAEYSDISASLVNGGSPVEKQYLNWFPSAFLSYKVSEENSLQLSYSRRLSRPRFRDLLPFSSFTDARNLRTGNPDLDPEYTHSFELGYLAYWDKGSLLSSLYYRYRTGVIERITLDAGDNIVYFIPVNLAVNQSIGLELSGSQDLSSWWNVSGNVNVFGSETRGEYEDQAFFAQTLAMNARVNSRMTVSKNIRFQVSGTYDAPRVTPQGRQLARYGVDLGASMPLLQDKATLSLSVRDLFNSNRWRGTTDLADLYRESDFQWRRRQLNLSLTYRINQEDRDEKRSGRDGGGWEEGGGGGE